MDSPNLWIGALVGLAGLAVATWAHVRYWTRKLTLELSYASCERIETADGNAFELRRIAAVDSAAPPVLIVHGLAANHRNDDLKEGASLARHLAAAGRDVWLVTLRSGRSDRTAAESATANFSAMAEHDVPGAVAAVLQRTGADALDYIGFSMGGMLCYATLGRQVAAEQVRRVVIIGSPGRVGLPVWPLKNVRGLPDWIAPAFPFRFLSRLYAFAVEAFTTPLHRLPINPDNCEPGVIKLTLVNMIEDVPRALNRELARWAFADGQLRVRGERCLDGLADVSHPVRFYAGTADHLAPPSAVRGAFDAWGGDDKELHLLGRDHGHAHDYGHGDLAIGAHASADIFAPIAAFLA